MYFQDPGRASAAAMAAMAAHSIDGRQQTWTVDGDLGVLADRLAAPLDVRLGTVVKQVCEHGDGVTVRTGSGRVNADAAIVTLPGPLLGAVMDLRPDEIPLADTGYSTAMMAVLGVGRRLAADELHQAYGILAAPGTGPLAALCVASRAGHAPPDRDAVTCMFTDAEARRLAPSPDEVVLAEARSALLQVAPTLATALTTEPATSRVVRIVHAMPLSPPGRVSAIARYRAAAPGRRGLVAGDSVAWPWTDSAAAAGIWAADTLLIERTRL